MSLPATLLLVSALVLSVGGGTLAQGSEPISFDIDVEAVLSKAGCNAGTCHGNQNGKGGFMLSLRGQDPTFDYLSLVSMHGGRRTNLQEPTKSLLLQKPTMEIAHQGGKRLTKESPLYRQLLGWISAGAPRPAGTLQVERLVVEPESAIRFRLPQVVDANPDDCVQLQVKAFYTNGTQRDVTGLAVYEPSNLNVDVSAGGRISRVKEGESTVTVRYLGKQVPVRVAFLDRDDGFQWQERKPRNMIDEFVFAKLREYRVNPAGVCSDHVFMRRAYLDLVGSLPTAETARTFVADSNPRKRSELVDSLLITPQFADNWALKWADLLRVEENVLDRRGVDIFHAWIRDSIANAKPLNQFVAELVAGVGSTYENPPANYYRALRKTNDRGEAAARVFLGTRLQCAQCHNHPFDRWTQDDYYSWAAIFSRIDYEIVENNRLDRLDKNQFVGEQIVYLKDEGAVTQPTSGRVMEPRFLGASDTLPATEEQLDILASWLTSPANRQFARAQVNRIWYHLMGKGLVDPVDDFRVTNPASHPDLLEWLTTEFISNGFSTRHLIRVITDSETYQLTSVAAVSGDHYARVTARRLSAEQLLDCQSKALSSAVRFNGHPTGLRAMQLPGVHKVRFRKQAPSPADRFLFAFGKPERLMTCECERSDSTTLSQALMLVNGECIDGILTQADNLLGRMVSDGARIDDVITELYWSSLSRPPSDVERNNAHSIVARCSTKREGLEDVAWALLNAKEFVFRQ